MSYYSRFEGGYEEERRQIDRRRTLVIDQAKIYEPRDLSGAQDGGLDRSLEWVEVPDPRDNGQRLTVRPVLSFISGSAPDAREKDRFDRGLYGIMLEGRLPDGDEHVIGSMTFFHTDGQLRHPPGLTVNMSSEDGVGRPVDWASADAELWLKTAAAALDAQA